MPETTKKSSVASNPNPQPAKDEAAVAKALEKDMSAKGLQEETAPKVERENLFKFGPAPIQTAEDAREQYLRGLITEKEFERAMGEFGTLSGQFHNAVEPYDAAFHNKVPSYYKDVQPMVFDDIDVRLEAVEEKASDREKATKEAEKASKEQK